jgi:hypothetical protein
MRTKTLALSAVLGLLGSASVMAQNVYSVNAVGYINVTLQPGFNIITCPLIVGTEVNGSVTVTNDLNLLFPNPYPALPYQGAQVYQFNNGGGFGSSDIGNSYSAGWANGGKDVSLPPGTAVFFQNPHAIGGAIETATFVGTVPSGTISTHLPKGYSLVGSAVPVSGDLVTSSISAVDSFAQSGDVVLFFNPAKAGQFQSGFASDAYSYGSWQGFSPVGPNEGVNNDPVVPNPYEGFFYQNNSGASETWSETFSVN